MDEAFRTAVTRAFDRQLDEAFCGTSHAVTESSAPPAPPLTLATLERAIDAVTTDRRTIVTGNLRALRAAFEPHGWEIVAAQGERGYWLRTTGGRRWRIRVYRTRWLRGRRSVLIFDPDAAAAPQQIDAGAVLTTVTALAFAGVDERVG